MPKIAYQRLRFGREAQAAIDNANAIIAQYEQQGIQLTLRQLYYQFVSRGLIPNTQREYDKLGVTVSRARLAGLIDWNRIDDRTRSSRVPWFISSPEDLVRNLHYSVKYDRWGNQPEHIEVWIEKDALVSVIEGVCQELDVTYLACRGYTSQSEMWKSSQRLLGHIEAGQNVRIFHLGDHDPSGLDMSRDIQERLDMFLEYHGAGRMLEFERLALNMDQVIQYNPPPNPAKITDSRASKYIDEWGDESWELDALEPTVIVQLIRDAIEPLRDEDLLREVEEEEEEGKRLLRALRDRWDEVKEMLTA